MSFVQLPSNGGHSPISDTGSTVQSALDLDVF